MKIVEKTNQWLQGGGTCFNTFSMFSFDTLCENLETLEWREKRVWTHSILPLWTNYVVWLFKIAIQTQMWQCQHKCENTRPMWTMLSQTTYLFPLRWSPTIKTWNCLWLGDKTNTFSGSLVGVSSLSNSAAPAGTRGRGSDETRTPCRQNGETQTARWSIQTISVRSNQDILVGASHAVCVYIS